MIHELEQYVFNFLLSYAGQPLLVYVGIALLMTAGSLGLPLSEEIIIISAGLMAFIGSHPELYPLQSPSQVTVSGAAVVCFLSVFLSDVLVYLMGRFFSPLIRGQKYFHRLISKKKMEKVSRLITRYGYFYPAIFRFTPGLRFPGHFSSGFFRIPLSQFIFVDGLTALLIVPTQVILIGLFGRPIIQHLKEFILITGFVVLSTACFIVFKNLKGGNK